MKLYQIFQLCILFLNLLNVNGLIKKVKPTFSNNIKYEKLILKELKENLSEPEVYPSNEYRLNIGNALNVLHRELPLVFVLKNLNFDIFSSQITVVSNTKKISIPKKVYIASIKS